MQEVLKFEKEGCIPCKKLDKILSQLDVDVRHIDIEDNENQDLLKDFGIQSVPVLVKIDSENMMIDKLYGINHTISEYKEFLGV